MSETLNVWDDQVDVDQVLRHLGRYGSYQIILYVQILLGILPAAINILANVFTGFDPDYHCELLDNQTLLKLHHDIGDIIEIDYEKCAVKVMKTTRESALQTLTCADKYAYATGKYTSFVSEWDLVCDKEELGKLVTTVFHVGMMIGAALFPALADKYGRKPVYVGSRISTFIVNLTAIFSPNYPFFLVCRFLCGLLQPGMNVPGTIMIAELFPTENRTHVLLLGGVMWVFGVIVMAPIAYVFRHFNWRVLHAVFTLFFCFSLIEIWSLDESIRWLIAKNRWIEAKRLIRKAAQKNDVDYNQVAYVYRHFDPLESDGQAPDVISQQITETHLSNEETTNAIVHIENDHHKPVERGTHSISFKIESCTEETITRNSDDEEQDSECSRYDNNYEEDDYSGCYEEALEILEMENPKDNGEFDYDIIENNYIDACPRLMRMSPSTEDITVVESVPMKSLIVCQTSVNLRHDKSLVTDMTPKKYLMPQCQLPGMLYIIKEPVLRRMTFICLYLWFVNTLVYYGLYLTSASLAGNRYLNFFLYALAEFPSQVLALKLLISIGRKKTCIIFQSIAGGSLIIAVIFRMCSSDDTYIVMAATVFSLIGMFGISGSFLVIWLYTPELFPTGLRNAGMGLASTASRSGSMLSPFSGTLARYISWGPSVIFASFCLVANLLVVALPETGHRQLPQTVGDIRRWSDERDETWDSQSLHQMMRFVWAGTIQTDNRNTRSNTD